MKILVATGSYPPGIGGPATYSRLLADRLPQMGIGVDIFSFGQVRHLPKAIRHLIYAVKMLWHAREADAVFAQDAASVGLPALFASFILGKPFMVRIPGDYAWEQSKRFGVNDTMEDFQHKRYGAKIERLRKLQRLVVRNADVVIAPSQAFAAVVKGWIKDKNKVHAIYNGIDVVGLEKVVAGVSVKPKTIISAGRLVYNKGFDMLIKAMVKLPDWSLEIAGDGPEQAKLEKLIEDGGLANRVRLIGRLDRDDLMRKVAGSEIFALNTYFETFSFQIVEALAVGTPVVATPVGSLREIIMDGVSGVFFEPNSESGFLSAVERLSEDAGFRARLSTEGKKRARDFSIDATVEKVRSLIAPLATGLASKAYKRRIRASKILRYLMSGGLAALVNIALLFVFTDILNIWYLISSVLSFLISFVVSFILQKFFTFQDHGVKGVHGQALIYLLVTGTNLIINTALIYLFVEYLHFHYIPAQIVTSILVAIESFIIYGMFIFNRKPSKNGLIS